MPGGNTTQFLLVPTLERRNRGLVLAGTAAFWLVCALLTALGLGASLLTGAIHSRLALFGSPFVILAALIPNVIIAIILPRAQRFQRTHRYVLLGAFLGGAIIAIPPSALLELGPSILLRDSPLFYGTVPGLVEEGIKGAILLSIYYFQRDEFHDPVDGIVLGALIGLGFAVTEDIVYFVNALAHGGLASFAVTVVLRVFFGWMNHSTFTACFGAALGVARMGPRGARRPLIAGLGLALAVGLHNTFNLLASLLPAILVVPLYGITWTALVGLGVLTYVGWHSQARLMREELAPERAAGVLTEEEYAHVVDARTRHRALQAAATVGARQALDQFYQLAMRLALQRRHTLYGDPPRVPHLHSEASLRERIAAARDRLTTTASRSTPRGAVAPAAATPEIPGRARPYTDPASYPLLALEVTTGPQTGLVQPLLDGTTIGRSASRTILTLLDGEVSGLHARVERNGGLPVLVDTSSTNGTFVNGVRITRQPLRPGDLVRLGATELRVGLAALLGNQPTP